MRAHGAARGRLEPTHREDRIVLSGELLGPCTAPPIREDPDAALDGDRHRG